MCSKLVEKNADPEMFNMNKLSPLDIALKRSDTQLRRIFRPSESDKDFTPAARKQSNLHAAIESNDEEIAAIELGGIGAADAAKIQGVTPLMMAARVGSATTWFIARWLAVPHVHRAGGCLGLTGTGGYTHHGHLW